MSAINVVMFLVSAIVVAAVIGVIGAALVDRFERSGRTQRLVQHPPVHQFRRSELRSDQELAARS